MLLLCYVIIRVLRQDSSEFLYTIDTIVPFRLDLISFPFLFRLSLSVFINIFAREEKKTEKPSYCEVKQEIQCCYQWFRPLQFSCAKTPENLGCKISDEMKRLERLSSILILTKVSSPEQDLKILIWRLCLASLYPAATTNFPAIIIFNYKGWKPT